MPSPVIRSSIHFLWLCVGMFAKIINYYVICCSSFDALLEIQRVSLLQLFAGNFVFAANYAILKEDIGGFLVITIAQCICWCLALLKMPMEMTILTSLLIIFMEGYRYCHFMILSIHWAKFVVEYSLGTYLFPQIHLFFVFLLSAICSFALLPVVRDMSKISLYIVICYTAKYYFTGTLNFIAQPFNIKYSSMLYRMNPMTQAFLICLIITFPNDSVRIVKYITRNMIQW